MSRKDIFVFAGSDTLLETGRQMAARTGGTVVPVYEQDGTALADTLRTQLPYALLLDDTRENRVLAGTVAALSGAMLVTGAERVKVLARDRKIVWNKSSFGGFLESEVTGSRDVTHIGLVQTQTVKRTAELPSHLPASPVLLHTTPKPALDLEHADVIVAGGRGAGGEKGFALIRELADALGGVVGASRFAVDQGWAGKESLVGQSGKTVKPKLYIACGISGSVQHITGMRNADCVVSVNTDKKALIFNVSDYCIVGDLFEVLPALIEKARAR